MHICGMYEGMAHEKGKEKDEEDDEGDGGASLCVLASAPPTWVLLLLPVTLSFFTLRVPISLVVLAATRGY